MRGSISKLQWMAPKEGELKLSSSLHTYAHACAYFPVHCTYMHLKQGLEAGLSFLWLRSVQFSYCVFLTHVDLAGGPSCLLLTLHRSSVLGVLQTHCSSGYQDGCINQAVPSRHAAPQTVSLQEEMAFAHGFRGLSLWSVGSFMSHLSEVEHPYEARHSIQEAGGNDRVLVRSWEGPSVT